MRPATPISARRMIRQLKNHLKKRRVVVRCHIVGWGDGEVVMATFRSRDRGLRGAVTAWSRHRAFLGVSGFGQRTDQLRQHAALFEERAKLVARRWLRLASDLRCRFRRSE